MNPIPLRPWWLRKRIFFPLVLFVGIGITGLIAFVNSDDSTIVIYNETDNPLPPLLVGACGQTRTFPTLADQESVLFVLKPDGAESAIHLELAADPPWKWDGELIRPHGGHRVTIRLLPDGQVEAYDQISWWRR
jgi:hypothetical protein